MKRLNFLKLIFFIISIGLAWLFLKELPKNIVPAPLVIVLACIFGFLFGMLVLHAESLLRKVHIKTFVGSILGFLLGLCIYVVIDLIIFGKISPVAGTHLNYIRVCTILVLLYLTTSYFAANTEVWNLDFLTKGFFRGSSFDKRYKLLDTSVIIDGRILDLCKTGFLEGILLIPQFILHELQNIADSSDLLRRNRGRRGLDVLHELQKTQGLEVKILDKDFPNIETADAKLVELAKMLNATIITNDYNLNKVAVLQDITVLNINELSNAIKPVVLPGEVLRVFIVKEGKEYDQGVAYLDDGTMVVVDNARKAISKNVEISVTSVLQTAAGRMIFGKLTDKVSAEINSMVYKD